MNNSKADMEFCQADQPAGTVDFVPAIRLHSDLLAKMSTVLAKLVYSTVNLLDRASKPANLVNRSKNM